MFQEHHRLAHRVSQTNQHAWEAVDVGWMECVFYVVGVACSGWAMDMGLGAVEVL